MSIIEGTILVVDDNQSVLNSLKLFLKYKFKEVLTTASSKHIPTMLTNKMVDIILLDMNFSAGINSGNEGIFWLKKIQEISPGTIVVLITAYGDTELTVKAIKSGAFDFVEKPWSNEKLLSTLRAAFELRKSKLKVKNLEEKQKILHENRNPGIEMVLGTSSKMRQIMATVEKVAKTDANVLILGENGTGKGLIAQKIHQLSGREKEIFMNVDVAALPESLFETGMFGNVKGAFTDAKEEKAGKFEAANGGTLFLDEIGNLSYTMQAKLLAALQNREITRIGSNKPVHIDVRLICATNKNIKSQVKENLFREDLLYRINTVEIVLPPLRERKEDILMLAGSFLEKYAKHYNKAGISINKEASEKILKYQWPGNIRELKHTIEKAVILCESNVLSVHDFYFDKDISGENSFDKVISLEEGEKIIIENALKRNNWNISETAKELNIGRQTLYRKIEKYHI